MEWLMILQLTTGQFVGLPVGSQAECTIAMWRLQAGEQMYVLGKDGLRVPVQRGLGCTPKMALTGGS